MYEAVAYTGDFNFQLGSDPAGHFDLAVNFLEEITQDLIYRGIGWLNQLEVPKFWPLKAKFIVYFDQGHLGFNFEKSESLVRTVVDRLSANQGSLDQKFGPDVEIVLMIHQKQVEVWELLKDQ